MIVLGVDPGLTGAMALLDSVRGLLECEDLPTGSNGMASGSMKRWLDVPAMREILAGWSSKHEFARESVHAAIERPIPMPSLPAQTIASQFDTFGVIRATVAERIQHDPAFVNPHDWKKLYGLHSDKSAARECCMRLYPSAPVKRVKDHNRAEAILIGHFVMRRLA